MKKVKIYIDTSVIGGCFDNEFSIWSNILFDNFKSGLYIPIISKTVEFEANLAPELVRNKYKELLNYNPEIVNINEEVYVLMNKYKNKNILSEKYMNDLIHIAAATCANADVLVSWNFKHIVRFDKIQLYNAVNIESGYKSIQIYSPREVARNEKD